MVLIKIVRKGLFLEILYPSNKNKSIRIHKIKELLSDEAHGNITIVENRDNSVSLHYKDVEDPNTKVAFTNIEDLWDYIIGQTGDSTINDFYFMDGNNFYFVDANNFTFNT